ncbi:uncharacterized protein LOC132947126 isoform X1 [Metopolophium dirhodum]|uniref:uncharacterized protein LOC132947126 isoform X1 n=2 Tax=Metopolophium dirhodum TaxID=44670 RepID=UPI00298F59F7|nr:uncharacterized protein LOC132947126 isoform X1 [Metopolophium dirhodum]
MDIRWLCLVCIIMLSSCNLQSFEQEEDNLIDSMHNYTNLKIFLWSGSGDGSNEPTQTTTTKKMPSYSENPEDCIGGQDCNIQPTTSITPHLGVIDIPQTAEIPNKEYWIVTELNFDSPADVHISIPVIKEKLAILYTIAFTRQQARHLGLNSNWTEDEVSSDRNRRWDTNEKPIKVKVDVLSVLNKLDLVYFVSVNDHPVSAATAVRDMSLVTTREVADHLGYAVKIKARPYLDGLHFQRVRGVSYGEIWIFITATCIVILVLVTGVVVAHKKKRRKNSISSDRTNMAFCEDQTPHNDVKTEATSTEDIGALHTPEPKPRNRNKISNSLLSMQAVNKFQKDSIPGPLTDVLDGLNGSENKNARTVTRHESISGQDPGVVGPIVWDLHCKQMKIKSNDQDDDSCSSFDAFNAMDTNVTKMRQKFHELLDDAFTLFGSRNSSMNSDESTPSISNHEQRSKSAPFRCSATSSGRPTGRPKTSADSNGRAAEDDQLAAPAAASPCWALSPGEAWAGSDQSVFVPRPLSAGPFHRPAVRAEFISSDANLSPQDPAVPLIEAIRKELDRFPSPHADSSR